MEGLETPAVEETEATNGRHPEAEGSVLAEVRRRRNEIAKQKTITLLVPGYEGRLAVKYGAIPLEEWEKTMDRAQRSNDPAAGADALIKTCESILVRNEAGDLVPIGEEAGLENAEDAPVCFDTRLAEILGFEAEKAREIVMALFSPDDAQLLAIASHIESLALWLRGTIEKIDTDLLDF